MADYMRWAILIGLILYTLSLLRPSVQARNGLMGTAALGLIGQVIVYLAIVLDWKWFSPELRTAIWVPSFFFFIVAKVLYYNRDWLNLSLLSRLQIKYTLYLKRFRVWRIEHANRRQ